MKDCATNKILIALLFWEGDKRHATKLTRLLSDIEPAHSEQADFLFVSRFDCKHDKLTEGYAARKFNTFSYTSTRRGVGWPAGCTSIFFGAMEWVYHQMANHKIPHYKAILILGADTVPLRKDWLSQLHAEWDKVNRKRKIYMAGALIPGQDGARDHINGDCALLSGDLEFLKWLVVKIGDVKTAAGGWDWALADSFKKWGWVDVSFLKSLWRKPSFSEQDWNEWTRQGISIIHGVKDESLLNLARKYLLC